MKKRGNKKQKFKQRRIKKKSSPPKHSSPPQQGLVCTYPNRSKAGDGLAGPRHPGGEFLEQEAAGHLGLMAIRGSAKANTRDLS
jgi:hypothetical protein